MFFNTGENSEENSALDKMGNKLIPPVNATMLHWCLFIFDIKMED